MTNPNPNLSRSERVVLQIPHSTVREIRACILLTVIKSQRDREHLSSAALSLKSGQKYVIAAQWYILIPGLVYLSLEWYTTVMPSVFHRNMMVCAD